MQLQEDTYQTDVPMTDDSLSGPFKLTQEPTENDDIRNLLSIMDWLQKKSSDFQKGVFGAIVQDRVQMLSFVENCDFGVRVNGFVACPNIENDVHNFAREKIALELLDMASNLGKI